MFRPLRRLGEEKIPSFGFIFESKNTVNSNEHSVFQPVTPGRESYLYPSKKVNLTSSLSHPLMGISPFFDESILLLLSLSSIVK
jgi:hypothetical protein